MIKKMRPKSLRATPNAMAQEEHTNFSTGYVVDESLSRLPRVHVLEWGGEYLAARLQ
jgi:hypothetical protein